MANKTGAMTRAAARAARQGRRPRGPSAAPPAQRALVEEQLEALGAVRRTVIVVSAVTDDTCTSPSGTDHQRIAEEVVLLADRIASGSPGFRMAAGRALGEIVSNFGQDWFLGSSAATWDPLDIVL